MDEIAKKADSLVTGASYVVTGIRLLNRSRLRRYVVMPLLINIVLFAAGIYTLTSAFEFLLNMLPDWLNWLRWLLWPLFGVAALIVVFYAFSIVANIIASPFNGILSAAVERYLRDEPPAQQSLSWRTIVREISRTLVAEIRKLLYFVVWAIPCLLLFLIPGINAIAPILWFLLGSWMLAIEYVDCPLGNHGELYPMVKSVLKRRRRLALGFGSATMLLTMIPVLNFIAMPAGVAGATALYLDRFAEPRDNPPG